MAILALTPSKSLLGIAIGTSQPPFGCESPFPPTPTVPAHIWGQPTTRTPVGNRVDFRDLPRSVLPNLTGGCVPGRLASTLLSLDRRTDEILLPRTTPWTKQWPCRRRVHDGNPRAAPLSANLQRIRSKSHHSLLLHRYAFQERRAFSQTTPWELAIDMTLGFRGVPERRHVQKLPNEIEVRVNLIWMFFPRLQSPPLLVVRNSEPVFCPADKQMRRIKLYPPQESAIPTRPRVAHALAFVVDESTCNGLIAISGALQFQQIRRAVRREQAHVNSSSVSPFYSPEILLNTVLNLWRTQVGR